MPDHTY